MLFVVAVVLCVGCPNESTTPKCNLSVTVPPAKQGSIQVKQGENMLSAPYTVKDLTKLTLTAKPATGYKFVAWTGNSTSTEHSIEITMDRDKTIDASFIQAQVKTPIISGGDFTCGTRTRRVTLTSSDSTATIYYTTNGTPISSGGSFDVTIPSNGTMQTVKAIAKNQGYRDSEEVAAGFTEYMKMVLVKKSEFMYGADTWSSPTIDGSTTTLPCEFLMGTTEVTQQQYFDVTSSVTTNGDRKPSSNDPADWENLPVELVNRFVT